MVPLHIMVPWISVHSYNSCFSNNLAPVFKGTYRPCLRLSSKWPVIQVITCSTSKVSMQSFPNSWNKQQGTSLLIQCQFICIDETHHHLPPNPFSRSYHVKNFPPLIWNDTVTVPFVKTNLHWTLKSCCFPVTMFSIQIVFFHGYERMVRVLRVDTMSMSRCLRHLPPPLHKAHLKPMMFPWKNWIE